METRKASSLSWGHITCCVILLTVFVILMIMATNVEGKTIESLATNAQEGIPQLSNELDNSLLTTELVSLKNEVEAGPKEVSIEKTDIDTYITNYLEDIKFISYVFSIDYESFIGDLYNQYSKYYNDYGFNENNVGYILDGNGNMKNYNNPLYGMVEYIYKYIDNNKKVQNTRKVAYKGDSLYVENLIRYFTQHIYTNVDTNIALSIGAAESGYYKVKYMLSVGNVHGGMGKNGLIHYNNIEIGVLSYIKMLSKSYFGKGLTTINKIGYRYCPTIDSNGNKIASPHWVGLVSTAMKHYKGLDKSITATDLLIKK